MTYTTDEIRAMIAAATPGPWAGSRVAEYSIEGANSRGVCSTGGYYDNYSDGAYVEENKANARMIAAAPTIAALAITQAEEIERLRELLQLWDDLINHQYSGSREAMSDMTYIAQATAAALKEPKP